MNTAIQFFLLVDYEEFYGVAAEYERARELIRGISSITLLNYISWFDVNCYLNDNAESTAKIQAGLCAHILSIAGQEHVDRWKAIIQRWGNMGFMPYFIYNHSTLLFYGLIFSEFNYLPARDLTADDARNLFDAYLIMNAETNSRIKLTEKEKNVVTEAEFLEALLPKFAYQKDFTSSIDFSNQVIRSSVFFEYLENHVKYGPLVSEYYGTIKVSGWKSLLRSLLCIFTELRMEIGAQRNHIVNLQNLYLAGDVELPFIHHLCINERIGEYVKDESFSTLRRYMLCKINDFEFLVLDVNFFIDQFYKAQVFAFNNFLKSKGIIDETFLSDKAKGFMEDINLRVILKGCFPYLQNYFGDTALNSTGTELCDAYIRDNHKVCLVEFKDVMISAKAKNSGHEAIFFKELDLKFYENQRKKPKGIRQLLNGVLDVSQNGVSFDHHPDGEIAEIYPVIIYTDLTVGNESINRRYSLKFDNDLQKLNITNLVVHPPTFINLNFFELQQDLFEERSVDLFDMLLQYHEHVKHAEYQNTPFEVFSRFYMREKLTGKVTPNRYFKKVVHRIIHGR